MKPREFWIKDHGGPTFDVEVLYTPISNSIHVREVLPNEESALEVAVAALNAVKNNGAKANYEKWDVINSALAKIKELSDE